MVDRDIKCYMGDGWGLQWVSHVDLLDRWGGGMHSWDGSFFYGLSMAHLVRIGMGARVFVCRDWAEALFGMLQFIL